MFIKQTRTALVLLLLFTALTGLLYPLVVTGIAQILFPRQANGSLIVKDGTISGSDLIGQPFSDPKYFWGRLSATGSYPYNAEASGGSNYGPLNEKLMDAARERVQALRSADPLNTDPIPVDLVTASGSGLDPHVSVAAAVYQKSRVARARNVSADRIQSLVDQCTNERTFGFLGEPRVNVLKLNLALDKLYPVGSK